MSMLSSWPDIKSISSLALWERDMLFLSDSDKGWGTEF